MGSKMHHKQNMNLMVTKTSLTLCFCACGRHTHYHNLLASRESFPQAPWELEHGHLI